MPHPNAHTNTFTGKIPSIQQQLRAGENISNMRILLVYLYHIYSGALADEVPPQPPTRFTMPIKLLRSGICVYTEDACAAHKVYCTSLCKHTRRMVWTCARTRTYTYTHTAYAHEPLAAIWEGSWHFYLGPHPPHATSSSLYLFFPFSFSVVLLLSFRQSLEQVLALTPPPLLLADAGAAAVF